MKKWFCFWVILLQFGCSLDFAYKRHITGKYYLLGVDTKDWIHIGYELESGDFVGKVPANVVAYGILNDSLVVAQVRNQRIVENFYIIDTPKDSEYIDAVLGPFTEQELKSKFPDFNQSTMKLVKH